MWLKTFLVELDFKQEESTVVLINNQKNISLVKNSLYHNESKHIDIGHHYVRELVQVTEIMLKYCNTYEMSIGLCMKGIVD
jgi:c-di-AMP phosphodiesterase-like protein